MAKGVESARSLPEFRKQVADLENRLEGLKPILPDEKDAGDLLRRIQTLAVQSNLVIKGYRPQVTTAKPTCTTSGRSASTIDGSYHNLGAFLDRVSKFPRIINIGNLAINAERPADARRDDGDHRARPRRSCSSIVRSRPRRAARKKAPAKAPAKKYMMTRIAVLVVASLLVASATCGRAEGRAKATKGAEAPPAARSCRPARRRRRRRRTTNTAPTAGAIRSSACSTAAPMRKAGQQVTKRAEGVPGLLTAELVGPRHHPDAAASGWRW